MNFAILGEDGSYQLTGTGYTAAVLGVILLLLLACFVFKPDRAGKNGTKQLVFASMAIALSFVASFVKIFAMPMGGSVTLLSMFFITLVGYWYGLGSGLTAALAYGILQMIADPYIISIPQLFCDYILAFGALGLSGIFKDKKNGLSRGYLLAVTGRFFFTFLSGYIFFGMYAPEGMSAALYSAEYNAGYIYAEALITLILINIPAVSKALARVRVMACGSEIR